MYHPSKINYNCLFFNGALRDLFPDDDGMSMNQIKYLNIAFRFQLGAGYLLFDVLFDIGFFSSLFYFLFLFFYSFFMKVMPGMRLEGVRLLRPAQFVDNGENEIFCIRTKLGYMPRGEITHCDS